MATRRVSVIWDGPERDIVTLLSERTPRSYGADVADDDDRVILFRELDECDEATGEIVGLQVEDFLGFDAWAAIPVLPERWQTPGREPLPVVDVLKRLQAALRTETRAPVRA